MPSAETLYELMQLLPPRPRVDAWDDSPDKRTLAGRRVYDYLVELGEDELLVLSRLAERLMLGRETYGALDLATDRRDFRGDAVEEALDYALYRAMDDLREIRSGKGRYGPRLSVVRPEPEGA